MSGIGALIGLCLAIWLIIKKIQPAYALILGAVAGGIIGGVSLGDTVSLMISGVNDVTPAIVRVLAAGVLSGVLVVSGGADTIANTIVERLGEKRVYLALALATMLLTAIGVFIDVAVITIAPVAMHLSGRLKIPRGTLLLMMIGGGKCGNIISPNPNTIIAAGNFHADLYNVMYANLGAAIVGLLFTVYIIGRFVPRHESEGALSASAWKVSGSIDNGGADRPGFWASISGPLIAIALLSLRPLCGVSIDPLVALPAGGLAGLLIMRRHTMLLKGLTFGLEKMSSVAILLVGTGTIAGIIKASTIKDFILEGISSLGLGDVFLAPVSGMLMSAATASTTAGATVASASFADIILAAGISGVWGAAMVNSGATVFDHMPHGSFFNATGGVVELNVSRRLRLIPYESLIGFVLTLGTIATYFLATAL